MSSFDRTTAGFAEAFRTAQWSASMTGKPVALFVHKAQPTKYLTSVPSLVQAGDVEPGTAANLIHTDGSITRMFES